jgi:CheY-like chemotaxis protein
MKGRACMRAQLLTITFVNSSHSLGTQMISGVGVNPSLRKTVMICEDDPDLLQVYKLALRSKYNVVGVESGGECLEEYKRMRQNGATIDAMLLDYRLPDFTGDQIAMELKKLDGTKIIMISAFDIDSLLLAKLKSAGFISTFVKKPISVYSLGEAIDNALAI